MKNWTSDSLDDTHLYSLGPHRVVTVLHSNLRSSNMLRLSCIAQPIISLVVWHFCYLKKLGWIYHICFIIPVLEKSFRKIYTCKTLFAFHRKRVIQFRNPRCSYPIWHFKVSNIFLEHHGEMCSFVLSLFKRRKRRYILWRKLDQKIIRMMLSSVNAHPTTSQEGVWSWHIAYRQYHNRCKTSQNGTRWHTLWILPLVRIPPT
jgi:hypothetical protein